MGHILSCQLKLQNTKKRRGKKNVSNNRIYNCIFNFNFNA